MDGGVSIDVNTRDGATIVSLGGEVDMANVADVSRRLLGVGDSAWLVLDLNGLRYIDSAGIRMLFDTSEHLKEENRRLVLAVGEDAPVRRVLSITKLDTLVPVCVDVGRALDKVREPTR